MEQREDFRRYLIDLNNLLNEELEGKYFHSSDDTKIAYKLFKAGINPIKVLEIFMNIQRESPKERLSLKDLKPFLKELTEKESEEEVINPYEKISRLISYLNYFLLELKVKDKTLVKKLESLLEEEELLVVERELYKVEEELFKLLKEKSPFYQECLRKALKVTNKFSFYWRGKVLELTKEALIRKCLREKYGIPEFSAL